jgi:protease I
MRNALILTGKYVQDHEYIYPYYRLNEAGYLVDVAVPNKDEEVLTFNGIKVLATKNISEVNVDNYELLVIPGGAKAMEYLRTNKEVLSIVSLFNERNKYIASICHGAQLLISAGLVKGRRISGYYSIADDIRNAGGEFVDGVVRDRNIISAPHYKYLGAWMGVTLYNLG